ncbi:MAG: Stf0 family sulfotransferase [Chloroflexota bacterium]
MPETDSAPAITYLVLATPRSGSTLLGQALNSTDLAGDPREHFGHKMAFWARKWETPTLQAFVNRLMAERSTGNGVFGAKLLYGHLRNLERVARQEAVYRDLPLPEILDRLFPNLHYLWITRDDTVRQAISYWKAKETGIWGQEPARAGRTGQGRRQFVKGVRETGKTPAYDEQGIAALYRSILEEDAATEAYFREGGIAPMHVVYEQFVRDYEPTTRRMLEFLGIAAPADLVIGQPRTVRLADDTTDEWAARFRDALAAGRV